MDREVTDSDLKCFAACLGETCRNYSQCPMHQRKENKSER